MFLPIQEDFAMRSHAAGVTVDMWRNLAIEHVDISR